MIARNISIVMAFMVFFSLHSFGVDDDAKRRAFLDETRKALPFSNAWERWLTESGELPPDFDALPSHPELPDPLLTVSGARETRLTKASEWPARRRELLSVFQTWMLGTIPPPPDNITAETLDEHVEHGGATVRTVRLSFGPERKASVTLELLIPEGPGPFPVFLTQDNHRPWALIAISRGYIACVYGGSDSRDDTGTFAAVYPGYDWSLLTKRAWAASRCVDYLLTLPQVEKRQIAIAGHSRNGKQSLIAAALDERISLVISSSSGTGGAMPARLFSDKTYGESIEHITRVFPEWFHPRLRFFAGREQKLPFDMNELVALSAPRPCLLSIALNDFVENTSAMEAMYRSIQPVWRLLGAGDDLRIMTRPGGHETSPTVIERYLDWCDLKFGRGHADFPERFLHPYDWNAWNTNAGSNPAPASFPKIGMDGLLTSGMPKTAGPDWWTARRESHRKSILRILGTTPPTALNTGGAYGAERPHVSMLLGRNIPSRGVVKQQIVFGEYISGDIYMPEGLIESGHKTPAVLWLHPFSRASGYTAGYLPGGWGVDQPDSLRGVEFFARLASHGYVVFCFDQIGYGSRIEESEGFYTRYPQWSLLGKMVMDARAALDVMERSPYIDPQSIYVSGYSLGAMVALHLMALDDRPAGCAVVSPPNPFRSATAPRETGGVRVWAQSSMILPSLGRFAGKEDRMPYDVSTLFALTAPRPVIAITPRLDRDTLHGDITGAMNSARTVYSLYNAGGELLQDSPDTFNTFGTGMQRTILDWLDNKTGKK